MNIRSLTRGDGVVIGAAVLLFIASFLDLASAPDCSGSGALAKYCEAQAASGINAWQSLGLLMSVYLAGVIGAAIIILSRTLPQSQPRKVAGLDVGQFGVALTVFAAWTALWTIIAAAGGGAGLILGLIAALILAGGAVAGPLVPALKVALVGAPKPQPAPTGPAPTRVTATPAPSSRRATATATRAASSSPSPASPTASRHRPTPRPAATRQPPPQGPPRGRRPHGLRPVLVRGARRPPPVRRGRFAGTDRRTGARHLVPRGGAARPGPDRPDPGRPSRRAAGHHRYPARLTPDTRRSFRGLPPRGPSPSRAGAVAMSATGPYSHRTHGT